MDLETRSYGAIGGYGEGQIPPAHIDQAPLIVCAVMLASAWLTILLRVYTRTFLVYAFGWDDILMVLSLACFTVYAGGEITVSLRRTLLDHMTIPFLKTVILAYYLHLIFYTMTIVFLKLSVGVFLIRISNRKLHKRIIYATMAISTIWGLVTVLILIFQCGYPSSMNEYIIARVNAKCISGAVALGIGYSWAVVTTGSDFLFTALPLFILRDAQINKRARIVLSVLLTMGALGSVASLVRFAYVNELKEVNNNFFLQSMKLGIWSSLECGLAISAASLATLRPMFRKLLQGATAIGTRTKETFSAGRSNNGGSGGRDTIKMTESQSRSFAHRFSLSSKRVTMSTAKRLSDIEDVESYASPQRHYPSPGKADEHYSYEMDEQAIYNHPSNQMSHSPRPPTSPWDERSQGWVSEAPTPSESAYGTVHKAYAMPISRFSERY